MAISALLLMGSVDTDDSDFLTGADDDALTIFTEEALRSLPERPTSSDAEPASSAAEVPEFPRYEYTTVMNCPNAKPGNRAADAWCQQAADACPPGSGPARKVLQRTIYAPPKGPSPWKDVGITCVTGVVPGDDALTMAQIRNAFRETEFAVPGLNVQPEGNVTLVNLETYYEVVWPAKGFEPGEVDETTMLGHRVEIEPVLEHVVYHWGTGEDMASEPTDSLGGPYPDGEVIHVYDTHGDYEVWAEVTFSGRFRVDGGDWIDIDDEVTITGDRQTLEVKEAHARLVTD